MYETTIDYCLSCNKTETLIQKINNGLRVPNFTRVCENKGCIKYIDLKKVKTWVETETYFDLPAYKQNV